VEKTNPDISYKQINSLFHNNGAGRFTDVTAGAGSGFATPHLGRGVAFADFDNDGNVDVLVANNGDPPLLLRNTGAAGNHFVNLKLAGKRSNRDALGARVKLSAGGITQIREISAGGSYLSHSDLRAHFGLGAAARVDRVEIAWPSGVKQTFTGLAADRFYVIEEGKDPAVQSKPSR
jgi:hypothetical protein